MSDRLFHFIFNVTWIKENTSHSYVAWFIFWNIVYRFILLNALLKLLRNNRIKIKRKTKKKRTNLYMDIEVQFLFFYLFSLFNFFALFPFRIYSNINFRFHLSAFLLFFITFRNLFIFHCFIFCSKYIALIFGFFHTQFSITSFLFLLKTIPPFLFKTFPLSF